MENVTNSGTRRGGWLYIDRNGKLACGSWPNADADQKKEKKAVDLNPRSVVPLGTPQTHRIEYR